MDVSYNFLVALFAVFTVAAGVATLCLYFRQPLILGYILTGVVVGPYGVGILSNSGQVAQLGNAGIIFLLFLIGMELAPRRLLETLTTAARVTLLTSAFFCLNGLVQTFGQPSP